MERDDNKKKIPTSVEIVDVPPRNEEEEKDISVHAGAAQLSKEELYHLFNLDLAYHRKIGILEYSGELEDIRNK